MAEHQLLAHESRIKRYRGEGSVRQLAAGQRFELSQHSRYGQDGDGQAFSTLAVRHEGANNLGAQAAQVLESGDVERGSYRNRFEAQPADAKIAPLWIPKPTAPEAMVALVVGTGDDEPSTAVHTQRDHRVQVRFAWQAQRASDAAHATEHNRQGSLVTAGRHSSAAASVWLRVAAPVAGPNWGAHHLPRVGSEVLVSFIEGDIDRPVVSPKIANRLSGLGQKLVCISSLALPICEYADQVATRTLAADVVPTNVVAVRVQGNTRHELELLRVADARMAFKRRFACIFVAVAHQVNGATANTSSSGCAFLLVGFQLERAVPACTHGLGSLDRGVPVALAVGDELSLGVLRRCPVPILALLLQCHG